MSMVKLADVCRIRYGKDHKRLESGDVPVFGSGGVMRYVAEKIYDGPSVLIPRKGTLGNLFFSEGPFWTVDTLFWTEINESRVLPRYLYYALKNRDLASLNIGTAVPSLSVDVLNEVELRLPGMAEQATVTCLLGSLDAKVSLNNQINGYLAELVTTISKELYREYDTDNVDLPAGWRRVRIKDIATFVSRGITPKYDEESDEIILGQTCIRGNHILVENGRHHRPKRINYKWLQKGDLLINSTGVGSLGRTAQVWFTPEKLVVDSHITIVRASSPEYALYLGFWAFAHERYIESLHTGSTGQTELPRDHVKSISLVLPDSETLDRFNAIAEPATEVIVANQAENRRLSTLRDILLPKLMSGEIDVSKVDLMQLNSHLSGC